MQTEAEVSSKVRPIAELWGEWEERTGRPFTFYSAYPLIGRGNVIHNLIPHAEVEKRFKKALHIPLYKRAQWRMEDFLRRVL